MNELIVLLAVIVGFALGKYKDTQGITKSFNEIVGKVTDKKPTVAAIIHRPNAEQVKQLNKSEKKKGEEEAWKETMEKIPEIKEWRKKQLPGDIK